LHLSLYLVEDTDTRQKSHRRSPQNQLYQEPSSGQLRRHPRTDKLRYYPPQAASKKDEIPAAEPDSQANRVRSATHVIAAHTGRITKLAAPGAIIDISTDKEEGDAPY
jgi:hypothetical protein